MIKDKRVTDIKVSLPSSSILSLTKSIHWAYHPYPFAYRSYPFAYKTYPLYLPSLSFRLPFLSFKWYKTRKVSDLRALQIE